MNANDVVLIGLKQRVAAFSRTDGSVLWSTELGGMAGGGFVTLISDGARVFAYAGGHLHCLELLSGQILWSNDLPGFGYGLATLCLPNGGSAPPSSSVAAMMESQHGATGAAGVAGAS